MKKFLLFSAIFFMVFNCSRSDRISGTADDVNSGSIYGQLLAEADGLKTDDTVSVILYAENETGALSKVCSDSKEPLDSLISTDGTYLFDSLIAGTYHIEVRKNGIVIGDEKNIALNRNEHKQVNITIVIIINQTFNIWTDESENITVNNFYIDNGKIEKSDSGFVVSFAQTDTLVFEIEIEKAGEKSRVNARIIRNPDGTTSFEVIEDTNDLVIIPTDDPSSGYINLTIVIKEPGIIDMESTFDQDGIPKQSE